MKISPNIKVSPFGRMELVWAFLFAFLSPLLFGCFSGPVAYSENSVNKGETEHNVLIVKLFNLSIDSTSVVCGIKSDDIYFSRNSSSNRLEGSFSIDISITDTDNRTIHTGTVSRSSSREEIVGPYFVFDFKIPLNPGDYVLSIALLDKNSNRTYSYRSRINKPTSGNFDRQISLRMNNSEFIMAGCPIGSELIVNSKAESVSITYFSQIPLPPAPFSSDSPSTPEQWKSEATTTTVLQNNMSKLNLAGKGLYLFNTSNSLENARIALATAPHFPEVRRIEELILSARYIMTKAEYDEIVTSKDVKKRFDSFWLTNSGSKEKARSMIRTYYNRVITANKLFTCHKEGWQTDRGMIYIVLGPPMNTVQEPDKEIWNYPRSGLPGNDRFVFLKSTLQYDYNHFELIRNQEFKPIWMANVESWRTGRQN